MFLFFKLIFFQKVTKFPVNFQKCYEMRFFLASNEEVLLKSSLIIALFCLRSLQAKKA